MGNRYLSVYEGNLMRNIDTGDRKVQSIIFAKVEQYSVLTENYARLNAPWTDRTGNARGTLHTIARHVPKYHTITLQHAMPYGIWLEVRNSGQYAIILPTIKEMGPRLMRSLNKFLERM